MTCVSAIDQAGFPPGVVGLREAPTPLIRCGTVAPVGEGDVVEIVILNGAMGVGKTTTAHALVDLLSPALCMDADHIADFRPFDLHEPAHLDYIEDTLVHLVAFHEANGFERVVIAWVFETAERLAQFRARLGGHTVAAFHLVCDADEHERRVRGRGRDNMHWELKRHRELAWVLAEAASCGDLGRTLDVTEMTVEEVAAAIADQLR